MIIRVSHFSAYTVMPRHRCISAQLMPDSPMHIHPCHLRFPVALYHTEKFPAAALVKSRVIGDKIQRGKPLLHISVIRYKTADRYPDLSGHIPRCDALRTDEPARLHRFAAGF